MELMDQEVFLEKLDLLAKEELEEPGDLQDLQDLLESLEYQESGEYQGWMDLLDLKVKLETGDKVDQRDLRVK